MVGFERQNNRSILTILISFSTLKNPSKSSTFAVTFNSSVSQSGFANISFGIIFQKRKENKDFLWRGMLWKN